MEAPSVRSRRVLLGLSVPLGIALSGLFVWQASHAAFTATTLNEGNRWEAGTVVLEDGDAGTAMFDESGLVPGTDGEQCIDVTYRGTVDSEVRLYVAEGDLAGTLGPHLRLTVEIGDGGAFGDCSGFDPTSTIFDGTLAGLAAAHASFADGAGPGTWLPLCDSGESRTYRFSYVLEADDGAQGLDAGARFTWEAQST
jgi:hypothetical protein